MAKDLVNNPETKLGGAEKPYMDLGDHLEYIESLLEQGAGGDEYASLTLPSTSPSSQVIPSITTSNEQQNLTIGNGLAIENGVLKATGGGDGGQIIDISNQMGPDGNTIAQEGYDLIQQAYENNTLLGISFVMFDTIEAVCMFDYVSLDIETMTNTYCFKFEAGETIIFKIKSDLTVTQSAQSSIAVYSQFTDLWYEGDYVSAIMSNETIYKIPYTLIYTSKDAYQNERLQFKNDTYDKTIYNIPTLPADASSKNYALNSVNGALTWNIIGNGLEIKDGALQATIPPLPADASSKTYTLQTVNGTLAWTDAIGDINTILDNINGEVI